MPVLARDVAGCSDILLLALERAFAGPRRRLRRGPASRVGAQVLLAYDAAHGGLALRHADLGRLAKPVPAAPPTIA